MTLDSHSDNNNYKRNRSRAISLTYNLICIDIWLPIVWYYMVNNVSNIQSEFTLYFPFMIMVPVLMNATTQMGNSKDLSSILMYVQL